MRGDVGQAIKESKSELSGTITNTPGQKTGVLYPSRYRTVAERSGVAA